jgi:aryl carrier-like protein
MVPSAYVRLEKLPLTANGKLDRKALPVPEGEAYAVRGYEAPQGEIETLLAGIWAEVLKLEKVGRHDNFFALGGHSLLAITLIERMRQQALHADVRTLFTAPTLAELAASITPQAGVIEVPPNRVPSIDRPRDESSNAMELRI